MSDVETIQDIKKRMKVLSEQIRKMKKREQDPDFDKKQYDNAKKNYKKNPRPQINAVLKWQKNNRELYNKTKRIWHKKNKDKRNKKLNDSRYIMKAFCPIDDTQMVQKMTNQYGVRFQCSECNTNYTLPTKKEIMSVPENHRQNIIFYQIIIEPRSHNGHSKRIRDKTGKTENNLLQIVNEVKN